MKHVEEINAWTITNIDTTITDILRQYKLADGTELNARVLRDEFVNKSNLSSENKLFIQNELKTKTMAELDAKFKSQEWYKNIPDFLDKMARAI